MLSMQKTLRRALGSFKDQTSISLAKLASAGAPHLEIALVKATSHVESPIEEKHAQVVLSLSSCSRAYAVACVEGLSRRLRKTKNWIVAIKTLTMLHRLLRDGDPDFERELRLSCLRGISVLGAADLGDVSTSELWDVSAFVRAYGLYLDERLDYPIANPGLKSSVHQGSTGLSSTQSFNYNCTSRRENVKVVKKKTIQDMDVQEVMDKFPALQRLIQRVLACRPTGAARSNQLVLIALHGVLRESFFIYTDIRNTMAFLLDAFFDRPPRHDRMRVIDIYSQGARLNNELVSLYSFCKALGICKSTEYPVVEKIGEDMLKTMESFLWNQADMFTAQDTTMMGKDKNRDLNIGLGCDDNMKALVRVPSEIAINVGNERENLSHGNSETQDSATVSWEASFPPSSPDSQAGIIDHKSSPRTGWELALVDGDNDASSLSAGDVCGRDFNQGWLDSLYDEGTNKQPMAAASMGMFYHGTASSLDNSGILGMHAHFSSPMLGIPTSASFPSYGQQKEDPFAASLCVPPPRYVQMAEQRHKEELLVQEQQQWLQYSTAVLERYSAGHTFGSSNPFACTF